MQIELIERGQTVRHRAKFALWAVLSIGAVVLAGCTVAENPEAVEEPTRGGGPVSDEYWPTVAIVDWGHVDLTDPQTQADFAQADFIVLETAYLWNGDVNAGGMDAVRALNPDVRFVGYINAHGSWLQWGENSRDEEPVRRYTWDWFQATRDYWATTTRGDTMFSWPGKIMLDVLDPACREAMVGVLVDHWADHDNVLDGIFWDHFNDYLWVPQEIPGVEGELDLDGDGVTHRLDEDEMQAYRDAAVDLIRRTRNALGADVIQIANGQRAPADSAFASLLDGMFYETFPEYQFDGQKMREALDPSVPNNLFRARSWCRDQNGGPWLILSNRQRFYAPGEDGIVSWRCSDLNRAVGLLSGCLSVYYPGRSYRYDWPEVDLNLGLPLGEAVQDGELYRRDFENGTVLLDFAAGEGSIPFGFAIVQDDTVRQSLLWEAELP